MKDSEIENPDYHPTDHKAGWASVFSGFVLLSVMYLALAIA